MQKIKMKKRCRDGVTCVVLCTLPSIYLVCVVFGTAIPTSFYIFGKCFSYFICVMGANIPSADIAMIPTGSCVDYTETCCHLIYHSVAGELSSENKTQALNYWLSELTL